MNFDLTKQQQMIRDSVARFVKEESGVERFRRLRSDERGWEPEVWKRMGEYGWLGIALPDDVGGIGGDFVDVAIILEQLGRGLVPEPYLASVVLAASLVDRVGSEEQRQALLPPLVEGDTSMALAYAERQSRYRLADCRTTASRDDDGWLLSGQKVWVLNGHAADTILVVARTAGEPSDEDGLSLFAVAGDAAGLRRTVVAGMDGHRTAILDLDGVRLADDALLGTEGGALPDLEWAIDRGAAAACAEGQGHIQEMFERTVEYLKEREQFGAKIGTFQALQHRAAEMFAETELCRGTMILAALRADSDDPDERRREISAAKLQLSDGGWFVQKQAIQLHGGIGCTDEQDVGLYFKRLRVLNGLFGDADHHVDRFARLTA
ncbi:MAG: acyl-CoA dehydrogenase family protein [Thermoanaerobaculia bacterium]|nr:acyl-CoA dehydrogenase family protein [Thermoanaerobaculia bacterium]